MITIRNARAYFSALKGVTLKDQVKVCEDYAIERDWPIESYEEGAIKGRDAREDIINDLRPEDEAALVYSLEVLRRFIRSATADFATTVARISANSVLVVDVIHDVDSSCGDAWADRVKDATLRVQKGRVLHPDAASAMGKQSWHARQGIVTKWTSDEMLDEHAIYLSVWTNQNLTWEQARERMPDELRFLSRASLVRIFGRQRPGKLASPGRPITSKNR